MTTMAQEPDDTTAHSRWSRTQESDDFFIDEERLRAIFHVLVAGSLVVLTVLAAGLWRLASAAEAPPEIWGMADGLIFRGRPAAASDLGQADLDRQFTDTIEVLYGRTEKGLPPEIADFCTPEVVAKVNLADQESDGRHRDGFVRTLAVLGTRTVAEAPGYRQAYYRGLLASRSRDSAQSDSIYLECTFALRKPSGLNATGWRLIRATPISRNDYYRAERERAASKLLNPSQEAPND